MSTRPHNPFANAPDPDLTIRRPLGGAVEPGAALGEPSFLHNPQGSGYSEMPGGRMGQGSSIPQLPLDIRLSSDAFGASPTSFGRSGADPFGFSSAPTGFEAFGYLPRAQQSNDPFQRGASPSAGLRIGSDSAVEQAFDLAALNPLIGVASPLLWLAARLNDSLPVEDVPLFRGRVMEEIGRFETNALARGTPAGSARVARYALCAVIDDIVLNTAWGGGTDWAARGLVSTFYQETWGGERFFDLLSQLHLQPEEHIDALELMAVCLSIGFVGKYRVIEGGGGQLNRLRTVLYRTIRSVRGPQDRALSTSFSAVAAPYRAPARMIWFWLVSAAALIGLLALYLGLGAMLSARIDAAANRIAALSPTIPVLVDSQEIPAVPEPAVTTAQTQLERISATLAPDIGSGDVEVTKVLDRVVIRLLRASFPIGGAVLTENEAPMVRRIAQALNSEPGTITVVGHTDNVPISNSGVSRNNQTLSADRAASAAEMLKRYLADPSRVTSEGLGDASPIVSNGTAEGRARNRRVEFQIPAEDASQ